MRDPLSNPPHSLTEFATTLKCGRHRVARIARAVQIRRPIPYLGCTQTRWIAALKQRLLPFVLSPQRHSPSERRRRRHTILAEKLIDQWRSRRLRLPGRPDPLCWPGEAQLLFDKLASMASGEGIPGRPAPSLQILLLAPSSAALVRAVLAAFPRSSFSAINGGWNRDSGGPLLQTRRRHLFRVRRCGATILSTTNGSSSPCYS